MSAEYQKLEEEASRYLETHRIPDPYFFDIDYLGRIVSPNTGIPIEDVIDKTSELGWVEYEAFVKIQEGFRTDEVIASFWISPPYAGVYPVSKIIRSEKRIVDGRVRILNRAVILDKKQIFSDAEEVRRNPIFYRRGQEQKLEDGWRTIVDRKTLEMIEAGFDFKAKEEYVDSYKAGVTMPLGSYEESCRSGGGGRPTAFQVFSGEKYVEKCPYCGRKIEAKISAGYKCKCGEVYLGVC